MTTEKQALIEKAKEICANLRDEMLFCCEQFGDDDEITINKTRKWSTVIDAYAELLEVKPAVILGWE